MTHLWMGWHWYQIDHEWAQWVRPQHQDRCRTISHTHLRCLLPFHSGASIKSSSISRIGWICEWDHWLSEAVWETKCLLVTMEPNFCLCLAFPLLFRQDGCLFNPCIRLVDINHWEVGQTGGTGLRPMGKIHYSGLKDEMDTNELIWAYLVVGKKNALLMA